MNPAVLDRKERFCRIILPTRFTAQQVPDLQTSLKQLLSDGVNELEFDLNGTSMLDSSGIGLLTATSNSLSRQDGSIKVTGVTADIFRLLKMMRLVDRLNVSGRED